MLFRVRHRAAKNNTTVTIGIACFRTFVSSQFRGDA
jgi:hypothetical protein